MAKPVPSKPPQDAALSALLEAIAARDRAGTSALLAQTPALAYASIGTGASRADSTPHFYAAVAHYAYAGDTALHFAAAAYERELARELLALGASVAASNRRGATPLHYAADGSPGTEAWNPGAQRDTIEFLLQAGAAVDAQDANGATPLHRAVRKRCADAAEALLAGGADVRSRNHGGSTPLHLAVQDTGRGGSGSAPARAEQARIIGLLLHHGARPGDTDAAGKSVRDSARSAWILELLDAAT